jgi:SAM-dependent methyltransferase
MVDRTPITGSKVKDDPILTPLWLRLDSQWATTWAAIVAFYSIIHIPLTEHVPVLSEMRRVLRSGGLLLLAFHIGDQVVHFDELWGQAVSLDFHLFCADAAVGVLRCVGFEVEKIVERDPYPNVEAQTRRGYILASKRDTGQ